MPWPIRPQPTTPTFLIAMGMPFFSRMSMRCARGSAPVERGREAHPARHAERREPVLRSATAELVQERHDDARSRAPDRVAERDRAAVHVEALLRDAELAVAREHLRREGLVELDEVVVVDREPVELLERAHGGHGADAHALRVDAGLRRGSDDRERLEAELLRR